MPEAETGAHATQRSATRPCEDAHADEAVFMNDELRREVFQYFEALRELVESNADDEAFLRRAIQELGRATARLEKA